MFASRLTGVPSGIGPMLDAVGADERFQQRSGRSRGRCSGSCVCVVRSIHPGRDFPDCVANVPLPLRFSGQSIWVMPSSNDCHAVRHRAALFEVADAVVLQERRGRPEADQRRRPRESASAARHRRTTTVSPVYGWWIITLPTEGRFLYDSEEKLSQMLPRMAFVASGLQAFVSSSVTGTRTSVER